MSRRDHDAEPHPLAELLESVLAPRPAYADAIEASRADRLRAMHVDAIAELASGLTRIEVPLAGENWTHAKVSLWLKIAPQFLRSHDDA